MFKKSVSIAVLMAMGPAVVLAQTGFLPTAPMVITAQPGEFKINQLDQSKLAEQILNRLDKSRENDRLYVMNTVHDLNEKYVQIQKNEYKSLQDLSLDASQRNATVPYSEYFAKTRAYMNKRLELKTLTDSLMNLPSALRTSTNQAVVNDFRVQMQGQLVLDFKPVIDSFTGNFEILDQQLGMLRFLISTPSGVPKNITGITGAGLDPSELISQKMIDDMKTKLNYDQIHIIAAGDRNALNNLNRLALGMLTNLIDDQGNTEKYRMKDDKALANVTELNNVIEVFWARSYIRAKYGIGVGSLGIPMEKMILGANYLFSSNQLSFVPLYPAPGAISSSPVDLAPYMNKMIDVVKGANGAVNWQENPFQMLKWVVTRVKGNWNLASTNLFIVRLLQQDLYEESLLGTGGGIEKMHQAYKQRYGQNPQMQNQFIKMADNYDGNNSDGAFSDLGVADAGTPRGAYTAVKPTLDGAMAKVSQVNAERKGFEALIQAYPQYQHADQRGRDLFK